MEMKKIKIDELILPDFNPRDMPVEEMEKLKKSITEFGYIEPIIINTYNNHVVGGNQRAKALKELGYKEIDAILIHIEDINKEKACNIALNKISGEWNEELLTEILTEINISDLDIHLTGFNDMELEELNIIENPNTDEPLTSHEEDEYAGGLDEEDVKVKFGEIYKLGNHYLMCGDSNNQEHVNKLINDNDIDLIFTDPPYGIDIVNNNNTVGGDAPIGFKDIKAEDKEVVKAKKYKPIIDDDKPFNPDLILNLNCNSIIWGANNFSSKLPDSPRWLVWYKKPVDQPNENKFSDVELAWTNINGKQCKLYHYLWAGLLREGERRLELKERVHPTQKPVGLIINILNDFSSMHDKILDLFGGSGSTLIACEEIQRACYMMEIDPYYCQIIINRWEELTGGEAIKIGGLNDGN